MRFILRRVVPVVLFLAAAPVLAAWCPVGPDGDPIGALAVDPSDSRVVYANSYVSGRRLYKTVDGGETWRLTGRGLPVEGFNRALAVDPRRPAIVWAATSQHGVYKSTDAGASWSPSLPVPGGSDRSVFDLALNPRTPDVVYAASEVGAYKTVNGGVRWRLKNKGLPRYINLVEVDPGRPGVVYAAVDQNGLYAASTEGVHAFGPNVCPNAAF